MKKYSVHFLAYLTGSLELSQEEVQSMTQNEVFDALLAHEGYGHGYLIREMIKNIYGIDLHNYQEVEE